MRSRSAFTLVELIVVLAVTAVVVAILLPTVGRARAAAGRSACQANLRELGHYLTLYAQVNRNWLPARTEWYQRWELDDPAYPHRGHYRNLWQINASDELKLKLALCPLRVNDAPNGHSNYPNTVYLYLQDACSYPTVPATRKPHATYYRGRAGPASDDAGMWWYRLDASLSRYPIVTDMFQGLQCVDRVPWGFPHGAKGINVLFGDGHAAWVGGADIYRRTQVDIEDGDADAGLWGPNSVCAVWPTLNR